MDDGGSRTGSDASPDASTRPARPARRETIVAEDGPRAGGHTLVVPASPERGGETIAPPIGAWPGDEDPADVPVPRHVAPATPPRATPGRPVALHPGARLGRWILDEKIGDGATASVWAAKHEQLGAPVAIKIFHRHDLPFHAVLGEARAAAGIPSRNAIWVYDVDTFGGHQAIVMELCADEHARATSLRDATVDEPRTAARIIAEAARGVAAAHACDVFHKDIKPANILLNPADGRAQIADFGLANPELWRLPGGLGGRTAQSTALVEHAVPADLDDPWAAVRGSLRLGTPEFMAPEQAAGLRRDLDPALPLHRRHLAAIDVYGLGATLWFLLVGRPPYPREPDPSLTPTAIMDEVVAGPPDALAKAAPKAPRRLVRIVERAMHRDPLARYETAAALADDLEAWLAERPTSIDVGPLARAAVHLVRERARVGLLAALAVVTIGSSVVVASNARQIDAQHAALVGQRAALASLRADQERVRHELEVAVDGLRGAHVQLEEKDGLLVEREGELADRESRLASTSLALSSTREELTTRSVALDLARAQVSTTQAALAELGDELDDTRIALDRARQDAASSKAALANANARGDELGGELRDLRAELAVQRAEVDRLARAEDAARQRAATAEGQLRVAKAQMGTLRSEITRLQGAAQSPTPSTAPEWRELAPAPEPSVH